MKISIVTISYNQAEYLERAILSIISQTDVNIEYIVVDAGSQDMSREIIEKYKNSITKIIYEEDDGPPDGLNKGFSAATGDIFGFINADDELLPGAAKKISTYFKNNPAIDILSGCGYFINEFGEKTKRIIPTKFSPWLYANGGVSVFQQGTFFKSKYFHKVGGFNKKNRTCWDGELFLDMAMAGAKSKTIRDDLALFRIHGSSITGSGRLNVLYKVDCDRLYKKALKKEVPSYQRNINILAQGIKYAINPYYVFKKIFS
jgi:glycosyltransferase involved in cell wall biosynthesis